MAWGEPVQPTGYIKWDKPGRVVVGKYIRSEEKLGKNNQPNFIHFLDADGEEVQFWGTTILNDLLSEVAPGTLVRIEFTGERAVPNGKIKDFVVRPWVEDGVEDGAERQQAVRK